MQSKFVAAGAIVGAAGDIGLQLATNAGLLPNTGMPEYFSQRSPVVAVAQASALTAFWSGVYAQVDPQPSLVRFGAFMAAVDVLYRFQYPILYPTLHGYYEKNSPVATIAYNVITGAMVHQVRGYL